MTVMFKRTKYLLFENEYRFPALTFQGYNHTYICCKWC